MRFVFISSTGGSVMNELLNNSFFKSQVYSVLSDRECGATASARRHGVRTDIIPVKDKARFCDLALSYLREHAADYVVAFFTKIFVGELVDAYRDRIINLHPSLLPSFKGMDGFGDAVSYGVRYVGSTIHFIDEQVDEGKIILQTIAPVDTTKPLAETRHRIFEQQCRSLLQVMRWVTEGRVEVRGKEVTIRGARFDDLEFSPNLDFDEAISLRIPRPAEM
jgi:phosphoribosylglycinamide formyltransferase-1